MGKKYTFQDIKNFVEVESNSGCKLLSKEWINNKTKMEFECKCGNKFETNMNAFRNDNKRQCNDCGMKNRKEKRMLSFKEVDDYVNNNSNCKLLETEYYGQYNKMEFLCECGNEFKTTFDSFKNQNKKQCDECGKINGADTRRNNYEDVKEYIESFGCKLISKKYKNQDEELDIQCKCGEFFKSNFMNFKFNEVHNCKKCSSENLSKSKRNDIEYVIQYIENTGCKYISGEYKNQESNLVIECVCGNQFETTFDEFKNQNRIQCKECSAKLFSENATKTNEQFLKEVYDLVGDEYTFLEEYKGARTKILVRHNTCNNIYPITPDNFLRDRRCPFCAESKGEQGIRCYLENNDILFNQQYTFNNLLSDLDNPLRFDFAIFNDRNKTKLSYLVEYDGEFHYKVIKNYKNEPIELAEERLKLQQYHDNLKNEYCIKNNIKLIRIPYWEFDNIEKILSKELNINFKEAM